MRELRGSQELELKQELEVRDRKLNTRRRVIMKPIGQRESLLPREPQPDQSAKRRR